MLTPVLTPLLVALLATGFAGTESYLGPSLSLNFSENSYSMGSVGQQPVSYAATALITFTRSTAAWEWDWQGNYSEVAAGVMRIAHDPLTKSTSTTPQTIGTGSYTFAVTYQYPVGKAVRVSAGANNWMVGRVTASTANSVTIFVSSPPTGAGTYSAWTLIVRQGVRVEEQRTNLLKNSKLVGGTAGTVGGGAVIPGWWNAPFTGGAIAFPVTPFGPTGIAFSKPVGTDRPFIQQSIGVSSGTSYALSTRVVEASGTLKLGDVCAFASLPAGTTVAFFKNDVLGTATGTTELAIGDVISCVATIGATAGTLQARVGLGAAGDPSVTGTCTLTMPQVEVGATYSSNIPTDGSQVTRAADVPNVNTLAPWYNATEGKLVVVAEASNGLTSNINRYVTLAGFARLRIGNAVFAFQGTHGAAVDINALSSGVTPTPRRHKVTASYKAGACFVEVDGVKGATDVTSTIVAPTAMHIGHSGTATEVLNGIIESIEFHPRAAA